VKDQDILQSLVPEIWQKFPALLIQFP